MLAKLQANALAAAAGVLLLALSFLAGLGVGYYTKARFVKADQVEEMAKARKGDASSLNRAVQAEKGLQKDLEANRAQGERARAVVVRTLKVPVEKACPSVEKENAEENQGAASIDVDIGALPLGPAAIRVLNAAREGVPLDPAAGIDAAKSAAANAPGGLDLRGSVPKRPLDRADVSRSGPTP